MRVASALVAMAGWRLEHFSVVWVAGSVASVWLADHLISSANSRLILPYFLFTLVFYYGGNAVIPRSDLPAGAIAGFGEERAFRGCEIAAGLMLLNQGLGVSCMAALHAPRLEQAVPAPVVLAAGVGPFVVGLVSKLWATLTVGVDVDYFRDMFLGRLRAAACCAGPYRYFPNPMYSVGQLQGYGYALLHGSRPGCAAAAGHLLIYAFFVVAERPFVRSHYTMPRPAGAVTVARQ